MNFVEAWIKANGRKITRKVWLSYINTKEKKITDVCSRMSDADLLADDWEVLKEEKVLWTVTFYNTVVNAYNSLVFFSRKDMESWKKRHKNNIKLIATEKYIDEI